MTTATQRAFYILDMAVRPTPFEQEALDKFVSARRMMQANGLTLSDLCPKAQERTASDVENDLRSTVLEQEDTILDLREIIELKDRMIQQLRVELATIVADEDEFASEPRAEADFAQTIEAAAEVLPAVYDPRVGLSADILDAMENGCSYAVFAAIAEEKIGKRQWKGEFRKIAGHTKGIFHYWSSIDRVPARAIKALFGLAPRYERKMPKAEPVEAVVEVTEPVAATVEIEADITITVASPIESRAKVRKGCAVNQRVVNYLYDLGDALDRDSSAETIQAMIKDRYDASIDLADIVAAESRIRDGWAV
jgi:hypothetical protein